MNPAHPRRSALLGLMLALTACNRSDPAQTQVGKAAPLPAAEALGLPVPVTTPIAPPAPATQPADPIAAEPVSAGPATTATVVAPVTPSPTIDPERLAKLDERLKQTEISLSWLQDSVREMGQQINQLVLAQQKRDAEQRAQAPVADTAPVQPAPPRRVKVKTELPAVAPAVAALPPADAAPLTPRAAPYSDVYPTLPTTRSERPAMPTDRVSPARLHRAPPLPFSIEAVDHWGDEVRIVVKEKHGQPHDVLPGQNVAGWTLESVDGQTVTVRNAKGRRFVTQSTWQADAH